MSRNTRCAARCDASPVILKPVPLCVLHSLEVASEVVPGMLQGSLRLARREAAASRSPGSLAAVAAPPDTVHEDSRPRPTRVEAERLAAERLAALRARGIERVVPRHFKDIPAMTGRSRPWVYMWLKARVAEGVLVDDTRGGQAGYRFAA
jgi:hypothetical protein